MIDIHMHIIPGIDDGSQSMDESVSMVSMAYDSGVHHIVTTSHCYPGLYENYASQELSDKWDALVHRIETERIPVHLYKGMEIMAYDHLPDDLVSEKVWTINHTAYFLIEFEFDEKPEYCNEILDRCYERGFKPVIAHPERYYSVQDNPEIVYEWYRLGYGVQINKGSLLSRFGHKEKRAAESLLRHHLVHCVASDAHNTSSRSPSMSRLKRYLDEHFGKEYAYMLLNENPRRILEGRRLVGYEPLQYNKFSGRHER